MALIPRLEKSFALGLKFRPPGYQSGTEGGDSFSRITWKHLVHCEGDTNLFDVVAGKPLRSDAQEFRPVVIHAPDETVKDLSQSSGGEIAHPTLPQELHHLFGSRDH
jgi:hypothetical protein